ncbi:multicopper oxidase-domain-containing protein [Apodospora peruviana]|uniref:laccase n=1 Tax=Apodospora peruviana TaxID=516989 RepID=A0AAE0M8J3_9PEZI|nr:multicopper oxidase-domain-containing protein [Apodospora peruviana]
MMFERRFSQPTTACCAVLLVLLAAPYLALANPVKPNAVIDLLPRQTIIPGGRPCGQNNATNRGCWKNSWNISTDYEVSNPPAFNTRNIDFHITNVSNWLGPDGVRKPAMLINNQFPGPTVEADWGDYIQVNVYNDMQDNGTSIHWHGIRQFGESNQDGANGVTECPIPPGSMKSYTFHVTQYGTSWYHSHYSNQYGNGVVGSLIVHGPASANYDIDLGPYMMSDYYWETADRLTLKAELVANGAPPDSDNILFRGKAVHPTGTGGSYDRLTLTPGKKHLLRLINASVDNSLTVSLVGHNFTVIATDLVPVTPVVRSSLFLGVGQRYDVIIDANQPVANYWLNATLEANNNCGKSRNNFPAAIISYSGASTTGLPTNKGTPLVASCVGETGFAPIVTRTIPSSQFAASTLPISLAFPTSDRGPIFEWRIKNTPIVVEWDHPVLEYILEGNNSFPAMVNLVQVPQADVWTFWVIQNEFVLPHPIHLHGHDFLTLGIGSGTFNAATMASQLNFNNPIRRDVVQMPGSGWLVIAYKTDNPGCWLMHCHIGWHVSGGLGIQFLERKSEIKSLMKLDQMEPNCNAWRTYQPKSPYLPKKDSGLKKRHEPAVRRLA